MFRTNLSRSVVNLIVFTLLFLLPFNCLPSSSPRVVDLKQKQLFQMGCRLLVSKKTWARANGLMEQLTMF